MQESSLKSHGIWQLLKQATESLEGFPEDQKNTSQFAEARERIEYIKWVIEQSDPALLSQQELDQVQGHLQQIANHIAQSQNASRRLSQIDQWFAPFMDKFPYPRVRKIFRSERTEILNEFESKILDLKSDVDEFFERVSTQEKSIQENIERNGKSVEEIKKTIAGIEARVGAQFENWEAQSAKQIATRLTELNAEFADDQSTRHDEHQRELNKIAEKLREVEADREKASSRLENFASEAERDLAAKKDDLVASGEEIVGKIKGIYQIAGQTALAGDFENAAKSESRAAMTFAILSAIFFVITPSYFAYQWSEIDITSASPVGLVLKLTTALAFIIPAAYFGNTSRRHHRVATALRSLGIRVSTFDAYLANFPESERNRIKEKMAELFFAVQISPDQLRKSNPKEIERVLGLAESVLAQAQTSLNLGPKA